MSTLAEAAAACGIKKSAICERQKRQGFRHQWRARRMAHRTSRMSAAPIHPIMCCGNATSGLNSGTGAQFEIQM